MVGYRLSQGMHRLAYWIVVGILAMAFAGCSSTLVVLVPDPSGKVGEVSITTDKGTRVLTAAGESTSASGTGSAPEATRVLADDVILSVFGPALDNEPLPPERHVLFFKFDASDLQSASRQKLPQIYQAIGMRQVCDVEVNGHTDRMGKEVYNYSLSIQRAQQVCKELIDMGLDEACLKIRYYGESDPLVPTVDGVAKQVNRRVEIEIR